MIVYSVKRMAAAGLAWVKACVCAGESACVLIVILQILMIYPLSFMSMHVEMQQNNLAPL